MIDAKGPQGVLDTQGQDFMFPVMFGSGGRYNFNSRYGINEIGAIFGVSVRLGKHERQSAQQEMR